MKNVAVVGAGASGLIAARRIVELAAQGGLNVSVRVFESGKKLGTPILRSGNGRCNISNANIDESLYHNDSFAASVFDAARDVCKAEQAHFKTNINPVLNDAQLFSSPDVDMAYFLNRGLLLREENEGRLYPYANKSEVVRDFLLCDCDSVYYALESCVKDISYCADSNYWRVTVENVSSGKCERFENFDAVLFCAGSADEELLSKTFGSQNASSFTPLLCPVEAVGLDTKTLDNVRVRANVSLMRDGEEVASETGEILFRKYGVSGIAVFNLSRFAQENDLLVIDLFPQLSEAQLANFIEGVASAPAFCKRAFTNLDALSAMLLGEVASQVLQIAQLNPFDLFDTSSANVIAHAAKNIELNVVGCTELVHAQVHRGGVCPSVLDNSTLAFTGAEGMFVCGEAIDVDGPCGGYNLHFAWMSGLLAAHSLIQYLHD